MAQISPTTTKTKNGIATQPGACALITARTPPGPAASPESMVGSRSPKRPRRIIGSATPARGQNVTDRVGLDAGREREESLANREQEATSAKQGMKAITTAA